MKKYQKIDVSGDVGLRIYGMTLEELFENAASGLYSLVTDISPIKSDEHKRISLTTGSMESLLVQWLNELVFLLDAHNFIATSCSIRIDDHCLEAGVSGGYFDPALHERGLLIKAATYHNLSIQQVGPAWEATVIFDI